MGASSIQEAQPALPIDVEEAGPAPDVPGVLLTGPGIAVHVTGSLDALLQLRLAVPEPPNDSAIPVVLHRDDSGSVTIEPALWDPATSEVVVWTDAFSDRWGAWYDPRNWVEEIVQVAQGTLDFASDFITGRTDPPACGNNPPAWSTLTTGETSSLHVCGQSNPANDGTDRFELLLKSNRRTAQIVTVPSTTKDYLWTEGMSDDHRRLLTDLLLVDPDTNMALIGGHSMSLGFRQPEVPTEFSMTSYQTPLVIVLNNTLGLLGNLPLEGVLALAGASAKCVSETAGVDFTAMDSVQTQHTLDQDALASAVACTIEVLTEPELAIGVVVEVASSLGINANSLGGINASLKAIAPTATRIATGIAVANQTVIAWDAVFDNMADGQIAVALESPESPPSETVHAQWFSLRDNQFPIGEQDAAYSGCTPGTSDSLPDGVWAGQIEDSTPTSLVFDLGCLQFDSDLDQVWGLANKNQATRTLPVAASATAFEPYPAVPSRGLVLDVHRELDIDCVLTTTCRDTTLDRSAQERYQQLSSSIALVAINDGVVTEIAITNWFDWDYWALQDRADTNETYSYQDGVYPPETNGSAYSGCSPGTSGRLPDGVWVGLVSDASPGTIEFDLVCLAMTWDGWPKTWTNSNPAIRSIPVAADVEVYRSIAYGNWLTKVVENLPASCIADYGCVTSLFDREMADLVVVTINNGAATEIAFGDWWG